MELCPRLICPHDPAAVFQSSVSTPAVRDHLRWTELLSGREWATVVWVTLALAWMLTNKDLRPSVLNVIRVPLSKVILAPVVLMLCYIAAVVFAASRIGLWNLRMTGATLAWLVASALLGFFKVTALPSDPHYLRTALKRAVAITVLIDAYVNLFVLPFWAEMALLPSVTLLAMLLAVAETRDEFSSVKGCLNGIMGVFVVGLLAYATVHVIEALSAGRLTLGRSLILPMWLNLALLPFTYLLALWLVYQTAFVVVGFPGNSTTASIRRAKLALLLGVGPRPYILGEFGPPWPYRLNRASTLAEARQVAADLRAERNAAAAASDANQRPGFQS
jgi:hypothetical protein